MSLRAAFSGLLVLPACIAVFAPEPAEEKRRELLLLALGSPAAAYQDPELQGEKLIGPEGGTLMSDDGAFVVSIPPGAVDSPTEFRVQRYDPEPHALPDGYATLSSVYEAQPSVRFAVPVTVRLQLNRDRMEALGVYVSGARGFTYSDTPSRQGAKPFPGWRSHETRPGPEAIEMTTRTFSLFAAGGSLPGYDPPVILDPEATFHTDCGTTPHAIRARIQDPDGIVAAYAAVGPPGGALNRVEFLQEGATDWYSAPIPREFLRTDGLQARIFAVDANDHATQSPDSAAPAFRYPETAPESAAYIAGLDQDGDGLLCAWEAENGLDDSNPADAGVIIDSDLDGLPDSDDSTPFGDASASIASLQLFPAAPEVPPGQSIDFAIEASNGADRIFLRDPSLLNFSLSGTTYYGAPTASFSGSVFTALRPDAATLTATSGGAQATAQIQIPDAAPPAEIALNVSDGAYPYFRLQWSAPGDDGGGGRATAYEIRYGTDPINDLNSCRQAESAVAYPPRPANAGEAQELEVRAYFLSQLHYFCILAYDEQWNVSGWTASVSHTAPPPRFELTQVDATAGFSQGTFHSHNQRVVQNEYGLFMSYLRNRNENTATGPAVILRSTNGGQSFSGLHHPSDVRQPPPMETDEHGNIYFTAAYPGDRRTDFFRAFPEDEFRTAYGTQIESYTEDKVNLYYDRHRKRLYYATKMARGEAGSTDQPDGSFFALQRNGATILNKWMVDYTQELRTDGCNIHDDALTEKRWIDMEYPHLAMERDRLYHAWTSAVYGPNREDLKRYYSIHYRMSLDGGSTWRSAPGRPAHDLDLPDGALSTSPCAGQAVTVTPLSEHRLDDNNAQSWLANFAAINGKLFFAYGDSLPGNLVRFDSGSALQDFSQPASSPLGGDLRTDSTGGFFVEGPPVDSGFPALFYVGGTYDGEYRLVVLRSIDGGSSWQEHARTTTPLPGAAGSTPAAISGFRRVTLDGFIVGAFSVKSASGSPHPVWFFRVPAGLPRQSHTREIIVQTGEMTSDGGYAIRVPIDYAGRGPDGANRIENYSELELLENGTPLPSPHSNHDSIRNLGGGRYSHWQSGATGLVDIYFSSSDGTDPRTNGRRYSYRFPLRIPEGPAYTGKIDMQQAFHDGGNRYRIERQFATPADYSGDGERSRLRLFEDGRPLGPAHSGHNFIASQGGGAYSHWESGVTGLQSLYFSASDNSNPRSNGRTYSYQILP